MPTLPPDTSLTFQDLILRVAEETRFAKYDDSNPNSPAQIPTDRGILDKIKRAINDGISLMARDYPKWTSLRPQVSFLMSTDGTGPLNLPNPITGEPDPSIYRLPWYITGRPINGWHWVSTASNFSRLHSRQSSGSTIAGRSTPTVSGDATLADSRISTPPALSPVA